MDRSFFSAQASSSDCMCLRLYVYSPEHDALQFTGMPGKLQYAAWLLSHVERQDHSEDCIICSTSVLLESMPSSHHMHP